MAVELRPYQAQLVTEVRASFMAGYQSPLVVLPTGGGKTICFCYMADAAMRKGLRVLILAHRVELLDQISASLKRFDVPHGWIAAGVTGNRRAPVQLASVFTLAKRLDLYGDFDLVVIDEAHHVTKGSSWGQVIAHYTKAKRIGVTATPCRMKGDGLGQMFDTMVMGPTMAELIEMGSLSKYRLFAPPGGIDTHGVHSRGGDFIRSELSALVDTPSITGSALAHYQRLIPGRRAVAFCVSIEHAQNVAKDFSAAGIAAVSIDGAMDGALRRSILRDFSSGKTLVLTSCDLISEGFDLPAIEAAILLRPTQSLGLYLQQVGRALRIFPGKTEAVILDHAGNAKRHGLPDAPRSWTLDGVAGSGDGERIMAVRNCPKCFGDTPSVRPACKHCGHVFEIKSREIEEREGELEEIMLAAQSETAALAARAAQSHRKDRDSLIAHAKRNGYKNAERWADHVLAGRARKKAREEMAKLSVQDVAARLQIPLV
jgi:DNA repair protein RadD